jgi:hypothetical protein
MGVGIGEVVGALVVAWRSRPRHKWNVSESEAANRNLSLRTCALCPLEEHRSTNPVAFTYRKNSAIVGFRRGGDNGVPPCERN